MKITIDATPQELAEFIFNLVDADYHIELFDEDNKDATQAELRDKVASLLEELNKPTT